MFQWVARSETGLFWFDLEISDDVRPHPGQPHSLTRPAATLSHPMGEGKEGESIATSLKIYTTGLAGRSSAKPETIESYFLSWGRG
jgi:hypothetical protein